LLKKNVGIIRYFDLTFLLATQINSGQTLIIYDLLCTIEFIEDNKSQFIKILEIDRKKKTRFIYLKTIMKRDTSLSYFDSFATI
jgi:hypothetical protein